MYQNAGEKGRRHDDPADPPRRRANKRRGHGNFANDRPPVVGAVGRDSGLVRLAVVARSDRATLRDWIATTTHHGVDLHTDEWSGYQDVAAMGRTHHVVCHTPDRREWARDDDGDGVAEVHSNTAEGFWAGLRAFLRAFRGVSKWHLAHYVAFYAAMHNYRRHARWFLGAILSLSTSDGP